jgi:signal peptidase I
MTIEILAPARPYISSDPRGKVMNEHARLRSFRDRSMCKMRRWSRRLWREWRVTVLLILFVVVPVKSSVADWNWVPTGSMNPTILEGDLIYVDKIAYDLRVPLTRLRVARWSEPQRGDIVVCLSPEDGVRLVKRVIAGPADTVEMRNNVLYLNRGRLTYSEADPDYRAQLPEKLAATCRLAMEDLGRIAHPVICIPSAPARRSFGPVTVPEGYYFVLGDNRDVSRDSRFFGLVPRQSILGKARAVILSVDITDSYLPRVRRSFTRLR